MWIVRSSSSHAVAAPVAETRVRELVLDLDQLGRSFLWLSFPPGLVRVIHQAHHSTTPCQVLFSALSMFQLGARQDLWNHVHQILLNRTLGEPTGCHPFPAFPSSSSGAFVFLQLIPSPRFAMGFVLRATIFRSLSITLLARRNFNQGTLANLCRITLASIPDRSMIMVTFATCHVTTHGSPFSSNLSLTNTFHATSSGVAQDWQICKSRSTMGSSLSQNATTRILLHPSLQP